MLDFMLNHEMMTRLGSFFVVFTIMALWELQTPARLLSTSKAPRWLSNLSIVVLNTLLLRLIFPTAALGVALYGLEHEWGLFQLLDWPPVLEIIVAIILLDFAIYLQHVMVHAIPVLWRLHRVHHADPDFDVTTGARFHPVEILLSMWIKFCVIALLGPALIAVLLFELLLNASAMFNHSNIRLPSRFERYLRWFLVTPDMHRVHHSRNENEANSNFGFSLPWWDRLLGTYTAQPGLGHRDMHIGIDGFDDIHQIARLPGMLMLPFQGKVEGYAINRRHWPDHDKPREQH